MEGGTMGARKFGTYLREKREAVGISLTSAAAAMDISKSYPGEVERGERGPLLRSRWERLLSVVPGLDPETLLSLSLEHFTARLAGLPHRSDPHTGNEIASPRAFADVLVDMLRLELLTPQDISEVVIDVFRRARLNGSRKSTGCA
jgi:hypothetical protein